MNTKQQYQNYVEKVTPKHNVWMNMARAWLCGGILCVIAQFLTGLLINGGLEQDEAAAWVLLMFIAAAVLLTGLNLFSKLVKFGGAGFLVPITGFANSVASPAIDFQVQGQVFGIGVKIFTIAGPVILYGVFTSWVLGLVYWIVSIWR